MPGHRLLSLSGKCQQVVQVLVIDQRFVPGASIQPPRRALGTLHKQPCQPGRDHRSCLMSETMGEAAKNCRTKACQNLVVQSCETFEPSGIALTAAAAD